MGAAEDTRPADASLLATLQLADTAFPSGAYTLSGGLETLIEEGIVRDAAGMAGCVRALLLGRLARGDLTALTAAHRAASERPADVATVVPSPGSVAPEFACWIPAAWACAASSFLRSDAVLPCPSMVAIAKSDTPCSRK